MWAYLENVFGEPESLDQIYSRILNLLDDGISASDFIHCYLGHVKAIDTMRPGLIPNKMKISTFMTALEDLKPDCAMAIAGEWRTKGLPQNLEAVDFEVIVKKALDWLGSVPREGNL